MSPIRVAVGEPYPGRVLEGLMLDLFAPGGTLLRIGAPGWERHEVKRLRRGPITTRVRAESGALVVGWLFDGLDHGESPFDARLARDAGRLELPDLGPETRIVVQMHVVDTATGILRGLRAWTMPPAESLRCAEIVQQHLSTNRT